MARIRVCMRCFQKYDAYSCKREKSGRCFKTPTVTCHFFNLLVSIFSIARAAGNIYCGINFDQALQRFEYTPLNSHSLLCWLIITYSAQTCATLNWPNGNHRLARNPCIHSEQSCLLASRQTDWFQSLSYPSSKRMENICLQRLDTKKIAGHPRHYRKQNFTRSTFQEYFLMRKHFRYLLCRTPAFQVVLGNHMQKC